MAFELVERFDAFQDNPWPIIYKEIDEKFPGSKFILLERDPQSWIKSQIKHFGQSETPMRKWIYGQGSPVGNEAIYLERFKRHNEEVVFHFRHRPKDLLVMNLSDGDGWHKLCGFLEEDAPACEFPHSNKASDREVNSKLRLLKKTLVRCFDS